MAYLKFILLIVMALTTVLAAPRLPTQYSSRNNQDGGQLVRLPYHLDRNYNNGYGYEDNRYEDNQYYRNGYSQNYIGNYDHNGYGYGHDRLDGYGYDHDSLGHHDYGYSGYDPAELRQRRLETESDEEDLPKGFKALHGHHPSERVAHTPGHDSHGGLHGVSFDRYGH